MAKLRFGLHLISILTSDNNRNKSMITETNRVIITFLIQRTPTLHLKARAQNEASFIHVLHCEIAILNSCRYFENNQGPKYT